MAGLRYGVYLGLLLMLAGCGSIAKGVTEAVLETSEAEDTRACYIEGPASLGLETLLRDQENDRAAGRSSRELKVMMVHGIGRHLPGYSGRLTEHLMRALGLNVRSEIRKEFTLHDPTVVGHPPGNLRITRFTNKANSRILLFYELTWSGIIELEKKAIEFDNSGEYAFRRTGLNNLMKGFVNSHAPDPLIYLGDSRIPILASVRQSICWATWGDWDDYPVESNKTCDLLAESRARQLMEDDYAFVTHSLGSRIIVDAIQFAAEDVAERTEPALLEQKKFFRTKEYPVFMLANQLPLLQLGRKPPRVRGEIADYCQPDGLKYDQRLVGSMSIIAFSDPNDILSYAIPPKFAAEYMDSRVCPRITNVVLNVAQPISVLGLGEIANPLEAHTGYDHDDRVIAMIAHGIGGADQAAIVSERCSWMETTKSE